MKGNTDEKWFLLLSFVTIAFVILFCLVHVIPYAQVLWDEGVFLHYIQQTVYAINDRNIVGILDVTKQQSLYPPLHTFVLSLPLQFVGFSIVNTRIFGLTFYAVSLFLLLWLSRTITTHVFPAWHKKDYSFTQLLTLLLFSTGPTTLILASLSTKESMANMIGILIMGIYIKARITQKRTLFFTAGILLSMNFLTKYQYPLFLIAGIGIDLALSFLFTKHKRQLFVHGLLILIPFLVTVGFWIALQGDKVAVVRHIFNYYPGVVTKPWADPVTLILYYPRALFYAYHAHTFIGFLTLPAVVLMVYLLNKPAIRVLFITILIQVLPLTLNSTNPQERYMAAIVPFYMTLSAIGIMLVIKRFATTNRLVTVSLALVIGCFLFLFTTVPQRLYAIGNMGSGRGILFPTPDFVDNWFNYDEKNWPKKSPAAATETTYDIALFIANAIDAHIPYRIVGRANELSPAFLAIPILEKKRVTLPSNSGVLEYIITITIYPSSPLYTSDYRLINEWVQQEIPSVQNDQQLTTITTKVFTELGVEVSIYAKR